MITAVIMSRLGPLLARTLNVGNQRPVYATLWDPPCKLKHYLSQFRYHSYYVRISIFSLLLGHHTATTSHSLKCQCIRITWGIIKTYTSAGGSFLEGVVVIEGQSH